MKIPPGSTLVMIGDSITDCGRDRGDDALLGDGYVNLVQAVLTAWRPAGGIRILNRGIGGDRIRDLKARWQTDVLDLKPDWLSVMIGINDVWRKFDRPGQPELHVPIDEYEATLDDLLGRTRPTLEGLVLMTPYMIQPDTQHPMRAMMDRYGQIVRQMAGKYDALFADTQAAYDRVTAHIAPASLAGDAIHPGTAGHMVLARAFLETVGLDLNGE